MNKAQHVFRKQMYNLMKTTKEQHLFQGKVETFTQFFRQINQRFLRSFIWTWRKVSENIWLNGGSGRIVIEYPVHLPIYFFCQYHNAHSSKIPTWHKSVQPYKISNDSIVMYYTIFDSIELRCFYDVGLISSCLLTYWLKKSKIN